MIPSRSRKSTNVSPPNSRRRCTQPIKVTDSPACSGRKSPQLCVRFKLFKLSNIKSVVSGQWSVVSGLFRNLWTETTDCATLLLFQNFNNLGLYKGFLLALLHIAQGVALILYFIVTDNQRVPSADAIG